MNELIEPMLSGTYLPRIALSLKEAAKACGLSDSSLRKAMDLGELPYTKVGDRRLIRTSSIEEWLKSKERTGRIN